MAVKELSAYFAQSACLLWSMVVDFGLPNFTCSWAMTASHFPTVVNEKGSSWSVVRFVVVD